MSEVKSISFSNHSSPLKPPHAVATISPSEDALNLSLERQLHMVIEEVEAREAEAENGGERSC